MLGGLEINKPTIERDILNTVRKSENPPGAREVAEKVAREVIRSLVDRGVLKVTLDWKLRA